MCLPPHLLKYTTHLRRHTAKKYPQRIIDTPAVLFCLIPCICIVYFKRLTEGASFQKRWFKNLRRIYFVAAHKLILNVSKIRLRLICACASYLRRLFQKAYGKGASALSLHKKQSSTYSKYACGCFLCAPSICIVYFKRLTEGASTA